jgi:hypothetical protein
MAAFCRDLLPGRCRELCWKIDLGLWSLLASKRTPLVGGPMPKPEALPPRSRGLTAVSGAMALIAVLVMVQIWLLSAALESYLAGDRGSALPAAIVSGILFAVCVLLYLFIERIDVGVQPRAQASRD